MADAYILTGPDGRQVNLGSYTALDTGQPDFGAKDLLRAAYTENPAAEGGLLAFESVGVRKFTFPLRLASSAAFDGGLAGAEATLRGLARPGAYIDLLPNGVATGNLVRFDVLGGRYEEQYDVHLQRSLRRGGMLTLEVKPFGYSPSTITLASQGGLDLPGSLAVPGASVVGDVAGLAELVFYPTGATNYAAGTWLPDVVIWSLAAKPSFVAYLTASALSRSVGGTLNGIAFAPIDQTAQDITPGPAQGTWIKILTAPISAALEPAYRGRFRAFTFARLSPSQALPWTLSLDAQTPYLSEAALASAAPIATLAPAVASGTPGAFGAQPSPAYNLVDLGEICLPPFASGLTQDVRLRLWANPATTNVGVSTPIISVAGIYLQPLDGPAGILPRGLGQPTIWSASVGRLYLDAYTERALIAQPTGDTGSAPFPAADALLHYRGAMPYVTPSTVQLDLLAVGRKAATNATQPMAWTAAFKSDVSLRYRPRFAFLKPF